MIPALLVVLMLLVLPALVERTRVTARPAYMAVEPSRRLLQAQLLDLELQRRRRVAAIFWLLVA